MLTDQVLAHLLERASRAGDDVIEVHAMDVQTLVAELRSLRAEVACADAHAATASDELRTLRAQDSRTIGPVRPLIFPMPGPFAPQLRRARV
jgi:hypothetical protein